MTNAKAWLNSKNPAEHIARIRKLTNQVHNRLKKARTSAKRKPGEAGLSS